MAKYHINKELKVNPCSAKTTETCPYYDFEGRNNHYSTLAEAKTAAEKLLEEKHRPAPRPAFLKYEENLRQSLRNLGEKKDLPNVRTQREIISVWFNGDKEQYNAIKELLSDNELNEETRKEIGKMILSGIDVDFENNVETLVGSNNQESNVTILDNTANRITIREANKPFKDL